MDDNKTYVYLGDSPWFEVEARRCTMRFPSWRKGFEVRDNILYQDNKSAMLLETNGRASSSKRIKHINIRYYYVADWVAKGDLRIIWCPADKMIADFLTKPLQGKAFVEFRDLLMVNLGTC